MGIIQWNGVKSDEFNIIVEHHPYFPIPERKIEVISVPGRNGDVIIPEQAWTNVEQHYDLAMYGLNELLPQTVRGVMEWLMKPTGYARLEDSYNPDTFRYAYFKGGAEIENRFNILGRATVTFVCKPQRWLRDGERVYTAFSGMSLTNPTVYPAKPLIAVKGAGAAVLTVGNSQIEISEIGTEIDLDCDYEEAYYDTTNKNSLITVTNGFPILTDETEISWTGAGVTEVTIQPRWWTI